MDILCFSNCLNFTIVTNKIRASEVLSNLFVEIESEDDETIDIQYLVEERDDTDEEELNHDDNAEDDEIESFLFNISDLLEGQEDVEDEIVFGYIYIIKKLSTIHDL
jgi:hypothetical protein